MPSRTRITRKLTFCVVLMLLTMPFTLADQRHDVAVLTVSERINWGGGFSRVTAFGGATSPGSSAETLPLLQGSPAQLGFSVPSGIQNGDTFAVDITIDGVQDLDAWELKVDVDDTRLAYVSLVEGPFLNENGGRTTTCPLPSDQGAGTYLFSCFHNPPFVSGTDGSGVLATLTLTAQQDGTSSLMLSDILLKDPSQATLAYSSSTGSVLVGGQQPVILSDIMASPGPASATVSWTTSVPATSVLYYGTDMPPSTMVEDTALATSHSVAVTGLQQQTAYNYMVRSCDAGGVCNSSSVLSFTTLQQSQGPIFITLDGLPVATNQQDIWISGATKAFATVQTFLNDDLSFPNRMELPDGSQAYSITVNASGTFNYSTYLLEGMNRLAVRARDTDLTAAWAYHNVSLDATPPDIDFGDFDPLTNKSEIDLSGTVSETALVDVSLNGTSLFSDTVSSFNVTVSLAEGSNNITVDATDLAGNTRSWEFMTGKDTTPPQIENITPAPNTFFYEGFGGNLAGFNQAQTIVDIEGDTEPYANLSLYYGSATGTPYKTTTADANGHFIFEQVDIERGIYGFSVTDRCNETCYGRETQSYQICMQQCIEQQHNQLKSDQDKIADLYIVGVDRFGLTSSPYHFQYRVGNCFSGGMNYNIINDIQFQSPSMLSPERIEGGTEIIQFLLNLTYQGPGVDPQPIDVSLEPACEAEYMLEDERYQYGCEMFSSSPIFKLPNEQKNLWLFRYNLNRLDTNTSFTSKVWKDLGNEVVFPVKVKLRYKHTLPTATYNPQSGGYQNRIQEEIQVKCMTINYVLDDSRIDPRKVLPDWLINGTIEFADKQISNIDEILPTLDKWVRYAAIGCIGAFLVRTVWMIYRKVTCAVSGCDLLLKAQNGAKMGTPLGDLGTVVDPKGVASCTPCQSAWEFEATLYKYYRYACDRVLCHGSAQGELTGEISDNDQKMLNWLEADNLLECISKQDKIVSLFPRPCTEYKGEGKDEVSLPVCYQINGKYYRIPRGYVFNPQSPEGTLILVPQNDQQLSSKDTINVTFNSDTEVMMTELQAITAQIALQDFQTTCQKQCDNKSKNGEKYIGRCVAYDQCRDIKQYLKGGYSFSMGGGPLVIGTTTDCWTEDLPCCCIPKVENKTLPFGLQARPAMRTEKWDYRLWKEGLVVYSKYWYYDERDFPACFGQTSWIDPDDHYLDPSEHVAAFQCLCLSGIRARLVAIREILNGLRGCMQQIKETGEANAGICKEVFTQYVCELLWRIIEHFTDDKCPNLNAGATVEYDQQDEFKATMNAIFGGTGVLSEMQQELRSEYGNAVIDDLFQGGEGAIAKKICLGALTGDWGLDLEDVLDAAYEVSYNTLVTAWPAEREYLAFNPSDNQATFEYGMALDIFAGCDISQYTVQLACVSGTEMAKYNLNCLSSKMYGEQHPFPSACDCQNRPDGEIVWPVVQGYGGPIQRGKYVDRSIHEIVSSPYRFSHVKVTIVPQDTREDNLAKCIPEEHRQGITGVFYFPIHDKTARDILSCAFDQTQAMFMCDQGTLMWDERGKAYFVDHQINSVTSRDFGQGSVPTVEVVSGSEEGLKIKPTIWLSDAERPQCLYISLTKNGNFISLTGDLTSTPRNEEDIKTQGTKQYEFTLVNPNAVHLIGDRKAAFPAGVSGEVLNNNIPTRKQFTIQIGDSEGNGLDMTSGSTDNFSIAGTSNAPTSTVISSFINEAKNGEDNTSESKWVWIANGKMYVKFDEAKVRIDGIAPPAVQQGKTSSIYPYTISVEPAESGNLQDTWDLHYELRHMPENGTSCSESISNDVVYHLGEKQAKDFEILVKPQGGASGPQIYDIKKRIRGNDLNYNQPLFLVEATLTGQEITSAVARITKEKEVTGQMQEVVYLETQMNLVNQNQNRYEVDFVGTENSAVLGTSPSWKTSNKYAVTDAEIVLRVNSVDKHTGEKVTIQCGPSKGGKYGKCGIKMCAQEKLIVDPLPGFALESLKCIQGEFCCIS
ncbi:hypothetical protein JXB02_04370 [Candidatus Woesearchaeota archaeon]|nr:hypothetical protein [Candidatus Woesearchaeota archaeon]